MYGHLYPNDGTKIIVRSTTQSRMRESAEYFLAVGSSDSGFSGLITADLTTGVFRPGLDKERELSTLLSTILFQVSN
jgi:hypothetical protein